MARGRKNGCPVSIRDWLVYIEGKTRGEDAFVRIYGLNSLTHKVEGTTEDGSQDSEVWSEPYITKRSATLELEGVRKVVESTGETDPGQELLDEYAEQAGCGADATLRFIDPYGHGVTMDCIVTSAEESADKSEQKRSWSLQQVGEAEVIRYVQMRGVALLHTGGENGEVVLRERGLPELIQVAFTPADASNRRFRVSNSRRGVVRVQDMTESGFALLPVGTGTATITVSTVNNGCQASLLVTVRPEEEDEDEDPGI